MIRPGRHPGPIGARLTLIGLGAVFVMLGAHAGVSAALPPGAEFRPAPQSTLVTRRDFDFVVARWQAEATTTIVLALRQPGAEPRPVARLLHVRQGAQLQWSVQRLQAPPDVHAAADAADIETASLEHLYGLVFRQQPLAVYCLSKGTGLCDVTHDGLSHAQVLQALATLRALAAARAVGAPGVPRPVPWRVVELQGSGSRPSDVDTVSVRATGPSGPIDRLAVHFDRAPHSICTTRSHPDGVATCRLEDQHGDGSQHDHATAVVATFPGEERPDSVLLPTTAVLPISAGPAMPAFARPLALPGSPPSAPRLPASTRP